MCFPLAASNSFSRGSYRHLAATRKGQDEVDRPVRASSWASGSELPASKGDTRGCALTTLARIVMEPGRTELALATEGRITTIAECAPDAGIAPDQPAGRSSSLEGVMSMWNSMPSPQAIRLRVVSDGS